MEGGRERALVKREKKRKRKRKRREGERERERERERGVLFIGGRAWGRASPPPGGGGGVQTELGAWYTVCQAGCWKNLEVKSALMCKICT